MSGVIVCITIVIGMAIVCNSKKAMAFFERLADKLGW